MSWVIWYCFPYNRTFFLWAEASAYKQMHLPNGCTLQFEKGSFVSKQMVCLRKYFLFKEKVLSERKLHLIQKLFIFPLNENCYKETLIFWETHSFKERLVENNVCRWVLSRFVYQDPQRCHAFWLVLCTQKPPETTYLGGVLVCIAIYDLSEATSSGGFFWSPASKRRRPLGRVVEAALWKTGPRSLRKTWRRVVWEPGRRQAILSLKRKQEKTIDLS